MLSLSVCVFPSCLSLFVWRTTPKIRGRQDCFSIGFHPQSRERNVTLRLLTWDFLLSSQKQAPAVCQPLQTGPWFCLFPAVYTLQWGLPPMVNLTSIFFHDTQSSPASGWRILSLLQRDFQNPALHNINLCVVSGVLPYLSVHNSSQP